MKALLATIIFFSDLSLVAQLKLPAESDPVLNLFSGPVIYPQPAASFFGGSAIYPREKLRGKIRHIAYREFFVSTDSVTGTKIAADSGYSGQGFWYDEHGNILTETYFRKGKEETDIINSYDDKLRLIRSVHVRAGRTIDSIIYNEVENTIIRYQNFYTNPKLTIYDFDMAGNLIKKATNYHDNTDVHFADVYEYDSNKRVIRVVKTNVGSVRSWKNNEDTLTYLLPDDTTIYEYTDKENIGIVRKYRLLKEQKALEEEGIVFFKERTRVRRRYISQYNIPVDSLVTSGDGVILYKVDGYEENIEMITCFDNSNRIISYSFVDLPSDKTTYFYELDNKGNWIEERIFENGELFRLRKRTIEYFE